METTTNEGTLLIIDDEIEIIKSLHRQFRKQYKVLTANSAEEGIQCMRQEEVHVIISDQRMPGMNGDEFFLQVKGNYPDAMRLLLTGFADINAVIKAVNDGNIFRYITKPWDPLEVGTIVREAFEKRRMAIANRRLLTELRESNITLEQKVEQRTQELAITNRQLQAVVKQLSHLSQTDELTDLFNRRHWMEQLHLQHKHSLRYQRPCSLLLLDIDFFKKINDRHGHLGGDAVLRALPLAIRSVCREIDIPGRYGGEEFTIILPETDMTGAVHVAERLRQAIVDSSYWYGDQLIPVTISVGVSEFSPDKTVEDWIREADSHLYQAKARGRNCVVSAETAAT